MYSSQQLSFFMSKILFYLAIFLTLGAAILGYLNYHRFKGVVIAQNATIQEQRQVCTDLEAELKSLKETMSTTSADEEKSKKEAAEAKEIQTKALNELAEAQKQLADKDSEIAQLKNDLSVKVTQIQELERQASLTSTIPLDGKAKGSDQKSKTAAIRLPLKKEQVHDLNAKKEITTGALEGKILAVNAAWNFIVINLGQQDGVSNGMIMTVKRNGQVIAKAKISSVEPSTSAADVIGGSVTAGVNVQIGDLIFITPVHNEPTKS